MTLFGHVVGGALMGFGIRCYSLGLQMRPIFSKPSAHLIYAGIGASLGYALNDLQERQNLLIEKRRASLEERKKQRELASAE